MPVRAASQKTLISQDGARPRVDRDVSAIISTEECRVAIRTAVIPCRQSFLIQGNVPLPVIQKGKIASPQAGLPDDRATTVLKLRLVQTA